MKIINVCMNIASLAIALKNERRKGAMNNNTLKGNLMSIVCGVYMIVIGLFGLAVSLMATGKELLKIALGIICKIPDIVRSLEEIIKVVYMETKETMADFGTALVVDTRKTVEKASTMIGVFVDVNGYIIGCVLTGLYHIMKAMMKATDALIFEARRAWDFRTELIVIPVEDEF